MQVETISRGLGVILIMFFLGLEFNLTKLKKVIGVSLVGSAVLFSLTVGFFLMVGNIYGRPWAESITIGASVFLSSTVVVLNFLEVDEMDLTYGRSIMGILVMQVNQI